MNRNKSVEDRFDLSSRGLCEISLTLPGALLTTAAAGVGGALLSSGASKSAANTQTTAANNAAGIQQAEFNQTQQNLSPYVQAGTPGVNQLTALTTGSPASQQAALAGTPGYQFALQQGLNGVTNKATATGGVGGGNTLKALLSYGTGLADQTYQSAVGNAYNLASLGENAAAGLGSLGQTNASNIGNLLTSGAAAQAAGTVGSANAIGAGLNGAGSNFLLAALLNGGGGGMAALNGLW